MTKNKDRVFKNTYKRTCVNFFDKFLFEASLYFILIFIAIVCDMLYINILSLYYI